MDRKKSYQTSKDVQSILYVSVQYTSTLKPCTLLRMGYCLNFLFNVSHPFLTTSSSKGPSRDGTIGEDTIRASLISAVSDKLRWRMKEEMDRAQAELDALKRTEEDLKKGHQKLEEMVSRLDQEVVRDPLLFQCYICIFSILCCFLLFHTAVFFP